MSTPMKEFTWNCPRCEKFNRSQLERPDGDFKFICAGCGYLPWDEKLFGERPPQSRGEASRRK